MSKRWQYPLCWLSCLAYVIATVLIIFNDGEPSFLATHGTLPFTVRLEDYLVIAFLVMVGILIYHFYRMLRDGQKALGTKPEGFALTRTCALLAIYSCLGLIWPLSGGLSLLVWLDNLFPWISGYTKTERDWVRSL